MRRYAFVMDPLEKLDLAWDTSLCLLRELARRGHETILIPSHLISWISGKVAGRGYALRPLGSNRYKKGNVRDFDLRRFDAVLLRKDPPFDAAYLALTYLLEAVTNQTMVINHPRGVRNANEKLFGLRFNRWSPPTLVSADLDEILTFRRRIRSDLVVKPLYKKGGSGVHLLKQKDRNAPARLKGFLRKEKSPFIFQKFIPVREGSGDKRILLWKGEILGAFERIPRGKEFRSNLSLGGRFAPCPITQKEKKLVRSLRPPLLKEGLLFTGIDVRGEKLIEVNVTSPAGLVELERLYGSRLTRRIADDLEKI